MNPAKEVAYQNEIRTELGRNYLVLLLHGMFGQTGFRLIQAPTFLPAYLYILSGSKFVVGGALALQHLGAALSAIAGAALIEHRKRVLRVLFFVGGAMRLQVLGIALSGLFLPDQWALIAIAFFLFLFGLFSGMQVVAFRYVLSKLIPVEVRGRLIALRNLTTGLISAAVAYLGGSYFIDHNVFGDGYATTFLVAFALTAFGLTTIVFLREAEPPTIKQQTSLRARLKDIPGLLGEDLRFARFVAATALGALGTAALPFYILFVGETLKVTGALLGLLTVSFTLSQTLSNALWGVLSDRSGNRIVFLASLVCWLLAVSALVLTPVSNLSLLIIFAGLGAGFSGFQLASMNMVLEFGAREDLPMRIAIANGANSIMFALGPLLGGILAATVSYSAVFTLAICAKLGAVCLVWLSVDDPRLDHKQS